MIGLVARRLGGRDLPAALALAEAAGAHGVYVRNDLFRDEGRGELLGFQAADGRVLGLAWVGPRGNLILLQRESLPAEACARAVREQSEDWRIALGPESLVAALAVGEPAVPLVHRRQIYYGVGSGEVAVPLRQDVRLADRRDVRALVAAAIDLNQSDLNVEAWRVHRGWLKESVRRRVRERRTFVVGPPGDLACKVDVGSQGPAGVVLEGVYTVPQARSRGFATGLVATVAAGFLAEAPLVCLHVAEHNEAARRAYERAGLRALGRCAILLRG